MLCLPVAAALVLPSLASAATGAGTVRATVGGDGAVKSVKAYSPTGGVSSFSGELPIKVSISRTVSGSTSTYTYHVENTFSKTQTVTYKDTAGKTHSATTDLQLPLVAQLGIELPKSFKDVNAPQGVVETNADGVNRILYQLVLFSPLGAPTQDVTFTATGSGAPTMEMSAVAVNPSTTSGLSQAGQDANASSQQDDFWAGFASGGNGGLTQLATGMDQLVAGLNQATPGAHKLADGLGAAEDGAKQLDTGTAAAFAGSKKLAAGTKAAHKGSGDLSTGIGKIHAGQVSLTTGLGTIDGFLAQYADPTKGLPAAAAGAKQVQTGVNALKDLYVGSDSNPKTLLGGVTLVKQGVLLLQQGVRDSAGCTAHLLTALVTADHTAGDAEPCLTSTHGLWPLSTTAIGSGTGAGQILLGMAAQFQAIHDNNGNAADTFNPGIKQLTDGLDAIHFGLTHPPGTLSGGNVALDPGGALELLTALSNGLALLVPGLQTAADGAGPLHDGATQAFQGSIALRDGSGQALTGSRALTSGLAQINTGTVALSSGLGQLSAGQHQVATGLPAAVTGAGQLATGLDQITSGATQIDDGIKAVQSGAVSPLLTQLTSASLNAKKQLAILDASTALGSEAPGGQGTSYVLTQSKTGFRLAASTTAAGTSSDTGRNVGIGLGGLVVLVIAVTAGFALGRRTSVTA